MPVLSLPKSIALTFTGTFAFGLYFATLLVCLRWLLVADEGWKLRRTIRWSTLVITLLIFGCNVAYLAMTVRSLVEKSIHFSTIGPQVPYPGGPQYEAIVSCTVANAVALLADIVLIYRVWIMYRGQYVVVIFPVFFWLAGFVCTVLQLYLQIAHISNPKIGPYSWAKVEMSFGPGIVLLPFWISTVVLNAYSSFMLIRRIYQAAEGIKEHGSVKHLHLAIRVLAESGLIYFSITLAHLVAWFGTDQYAVSIISILNAPVIGIAFNWFLIRFEKNRAEVARREAHTPILTTIRFENNSGTRQDKSTVDTPSTDTALYSVSPDLGSNNLPVAEKEGPAMGTALLLHQLVAVTASGALAFGFYFATLFPCVRWLFFTEEGWKIRQRVQGSIVAITFLIFACNVVYLALNINGTMGAAWREITHAPPHTGTSWTNILSCTMANTVVLSADSVLIWRCWVVYGKRRLIVLLPCFLWLSALLCTILQIYLQAVSIHNPNIGPYKWASVNMTFGPGIVLLPFWICTVLLNAYSTSALVRRIYLTASECKDHVSVRHLYLAIRIVAESGLLNLSITFAHLVVWFGKSQYAINIISVLNAPMIGIGFNWFLIRFDRSGSDPSVEPDLQDVSTIQFGGRVTQTQGTMGAMVGVASSDTTLHSLPPDVENYSIKEKEGVVGR
ncbi:hypothetical protein NP233_g7488 [Leucocoprinus birnbaumii]|uniref:Uncharacterized protein n=1 Tax=Leucocoprinus birnbaumii TaxID=56174 RepID=A0AAD5VP47_9AGAR|nr:hypothetical protein NP233_g7488 [Leucocoprinus birnbaumii]